MGAKNRRGLEEVIFRRNEFMGMDKVYFKNTEIGLIAIEFSVPYEFLKKLWLVLD